MLENAITRRGFLVGTTGACAACAAGIAGLGFHEDAFAGSSSAESEAGDVRKVHSLCDACSSKCGFTAYVVDGQLDKMIADEMHPNSKGSLCARGYGYSQIAYSKDRLTEPLKRTASGFQAISWEQAYEEISAQVSDIIDRSGPGALALIHDPRPSGGWYANRFMSALGSPNVYTHGGACNLSKESGFAQVIGKGDYASDVENSKMTMFIGRSYADAIRPSSLKGMQKAHERGARIVLVDPRCNNSVAFADEWVPINPGTDLALVLAMSHVLVKTGRYDADFVKEHGTGFEEWSSKLDSCTPEWASGITGIAASTIERLANEFADAAPAASIEPGWRGAFGCAYRNSGETARAICLFNTLLGCWNQKGGALLTPKVSPGKLDVDKFVPVPSPEGAKVGSAEYPLALDSMGVNLAAAEAAKNGEIRGMFFCGSNMVAGYSNPAYLADALDKLDLCVVIDVQMSETAMHASYILPDVSYLERLEIPEFIGGKVPAVTLRDRVLDKIHPDTRPVDQIFTELAQACGVGDYFNFTVEELADAQLQSVGLSLEGLRQAGGTVYFEDAAFEYGSKPVWSTPTGKVQFVSEACVEAGLPASPEWLAPEVSVGEGQFRLISGKQANQTHNRTANIPELMEITKQYGLERVWLAASVAESMGIEDGDEVEISNDQHTGRVRCKVTERINPEALFMAGHYGCTSSEQSTAYGVGLRQMDFVPFRIEPGYGGACIQEAVVELRKVGA